jgi:hypothetical protein
VATGAANNVRPAVSDVHNKLNKAIATLEKQGKLIEALQLNISTSRAICYVQNMKSGVIHAMRAGDAQHTSCGWAVGTRQAKSSGTKTTKWLSTVQGEPWKGMCAVCMPAERNAAKLIAGAADSDNDSS